MKKIYKIKNDIAWDLIIRDTFEGDKTQTKRSNVKIIKIGSKKLKKAEKLDHQEEAIWRSLDGIKDEKWLIEIITSNYLHDKALAIKRVKEILQDFLKKKYIKKVP